MIALHGTVTMLVPYVTAIEVDAVEPVGEPGDGSIAWQRVLRVKAHGVELVVTFMADEADVLERL